MSQYVVWDRNAEKVLGIFSSSADATNAIRDIKTKNEGRATPVMVLETLTASDPDPVAAKHPSVR